MYYVKTFMLHFFFFSATAPGMEARRKPRSACTLLPSEGLVQVVRSHFQKFNKFFCHPLLGFLTLLPFGICKWTVLSFIPFSCCFQYSWLFFFLLLVLHYYFSIGAFYLIGIFSSVKFLVAVTYEMYKAQPIILLSLFSYTIKKKVNLAQLL